MQIIDFSSIFVLTLIKLSNYFTSAFRNKIR